jgi:hypothetical protein
MSLKNRLRKLETLSRAAGLAHFRGARAALERQAVLERLSDDDLHHLGTFLEEVCAALGDPSPDLAPEPFGRGFGGYYDAAEPEGSLEDLLLELRGAAAECGRERATQAYDHALDILADLRRHWAAQDGLPTDERRELG